MIGTEGCVCYFIVHVSITYNHLFLFEFFTLRYMGNAQITNCSWQGVRNRTVWGKNKIFPKSVVLLLVMLICGFIS